MTSKQDDLEEYKKAIRKKFEDEKTKEYSSFLLSPSRAKLRKLCQERMKNNANADDLRSFSLFLGFEFSLTNPNKLKTQNDKFRPIETFLKGESDLTDMEGVNIAAILVDFNPRPFRKFSKIIINGQEDIEEEIENKLTLQGIKGEVLQELPEKVKASNNSFKKRIAIGSFILLSAFGMKQTIFKDKDCMQWQEDHFERLECDCEIKSLASNNPVIAYNENNFELRKIIPCDTTKFFAYNKARIWYHKINSNEIECFNMGGTHPITDKMLKPISPYMVKKYLSNLGSCK